MERQQQLSFFMFVSLKQLKPEQQLSLDPSLVHLLPFVIFIIFSFSSALMTPFRHQMASHIGAFYSCGHELFVKRG